MSAQQALALPFPAASNTVLINARCSLRMEAGQRVIVVGGLPVHHYRAEDGVAETYAMVFLVESASPNNPTWRGRLAARCVPCDGTKGAMRRAGWRRLVEKRAGVTGGDVSAGNDCAASRC
jgi:hypothetical protein